jgi:peroxiredoxin
MAKGLIRFVVVCAALAAAASAWALELGEAAPELDVSGWAQGTPVKIQDGAGKTVFVIEFVSTFKPQCQTALAAAAKLYDRHRANGLKVVAVSTESVDEVKAYLADHKMSLRFAVDEDRNTNAAFVPEKQEVPYAVVVDRSGAVVYQGDPSEGMEKLVADVLAGKFDLKKAVEVRRLKNEMWSALRANDYEKADPLCEQILAIDGADTAAFRQRCEGFERKDDLEGFRKFVKAHTDRMKDDAATLSYVAIHLVGLDRYDWRDAELALASVRRAVEIGKSADADTIDTYAYVLGEIGMLDAAVAEAKKAVALDGADEDKKKRLAYLESCVALRNKVQPPAPPKKK